eukprot:TRINITY_DN3235_c0_g1_i1.p1 TRINITY_DN3235_c0_g1~~TRINITY_DN3235_c0_g1_i1.p1  ORF type:complete len:387 (-),score=97.87 TRINITY_DN3235_c0_g1_i1:120-1280(-)
MYDVSALGSAKEDPLTTVTITKLTRLCVLAAIGFGYSEHKARAIADVLLYAHLRDNSQGLLKLVTNAIPPGVRDQLIEVVHETPLSVRIDCKQEFGMVAMSQALEIVISRVAKSGFGLAACYNSSSSTGAIGYYVKKLAERGYVGFAMSQSFELVAPHGSFEPVFGTNPIAVGIPTSDPTNPIVLDMATSVTSLFAVYDSLKTGAKLPDDVGFDEKGNSTSDPKEVINGALKVFDRSYKGSHLALIVEILAGAISGGAVFNKKDSKNWGNVIFAMDLNLFGKDKDAILLNVSAVVQRLKQAKKLEGVSELYFPGERGNAVANERCKADKTPIRSSLLAKLEEITVGIDLPPDDLSSKCSNLIPIGLILASITTIGAVAAILARNKK